MWLKRVKKNLFVLAVPIVFLGFFSIIFSKNIQSVAGNTLDSNDTVASDSADIAIPSTTITSTITPVDSISSSPTPISTPTPNITKKEENTDTGKLVTVSSPTEGMKNVLASTTIPEIYNVGQEDKIKIKWKNNNNQEMEFHAYDKNGNGKLDYVEWTVPHLSEQTFEIIFISKALQLNQNKDIVADIYDKVKTKDGIFATIPQNYYVRVTFEQTLDKTKDITLYARSSGAKIEVYPKDSNDAIATFDINKENTYKVLLTNLKSPIDQFDLKVVGADVDIDYIVDPTPATVTDNFNDTTKIASSPNLTVSGGTVSLSVSSTWVCGNTLVDARDAKTYSTVTIGTQCWMSQNLNVGTLTAGSGNQGTSCSSIQKYCYSDNEGNCSTYGGLYQWNQAMCGSTSAGATGICPTGWHLPTHDEYTTLERAVCTSGSCATDFPYDTTTTGWRGTNEGTKLKSGGSSGFNGLLSGLRFTYGSFYGLSSHTYFWTSVQSGSSAWYHYLYSGNATVNRYTDDEAYGFSVRCLKN